MAGDANGVVAEAAAPDDQALLALTMQLIPHAVFWKDMNSVYLGCNQRFARLAGVDSPADVVGRTDSDMPWAAEKAESYRAEDQAVIESGEAEMHIVESRIDEQGLATWMDKSKVPLRNASGETIGVFGIFTDVTKEKEREVELRRACELAVAANEAKTNFLADMSHEIRTPMTAILGFTEMLLGDDLKSEQATSLDAIRRNADHLLRLINDILDLSKVDTGETELNVSPFDLVKLVDDVVGMMTARATAAGLEFGARYETTIPNRVHGDAARVRQILVNLVSNAIQFTESGSVEIRIAAVGQKASPSLELTVEDTGVGIPPDKLARIFEFFEQGEGSSARSDGAAGLGLAISRRLARLMGGEINVMSAEGRGSAFTFRLPLEQGQSEWIRPGEDEKKRGKAAGKKSLSDVQASLAGVRILLAEDGPDNQLLFSSFLRRNGAEVVLAKDGQEAIQVYEEYEREGKIFHVILMDMQMPRLDGFAATKIMREAGVTTPIIAFTAHAMTGDRKRCIEAGCDDYISKPVGRALLASTVARYCTA